MKNFKKKPHREKLEQLRQAQKNKKKAEKRKFISAEEKSKHKAIKTKYACSIDKYLKSSSVFKNTKQDSVKTNIFESHLYSFYINMV